MRQILWNILEHDSVHFNDTKFKLLPSIIFKIKFPQKYIFIAFTWNFKNNTIMTIIFISSKVVYNGSSETRRAYPFSEIKL